VDGSVESQEDAERESPQEPAAVRGAEEVVQWEDPVEGEYQRIKFLKLLESNPGEAEQAAAPVAQEPEPKAALYSSGWHKWSIYQKRNHYLSI
jgi:hypothetical protein